MVAAYFTDAHASKQTGTDDRLAVCSRVFCHLMKSWSGLIYLASNSHSTLDSFVQSLRMPLQANRVGILLCYFEIFEKL